MAGHNRGESFKIANNPDYKAPADATGTDDTVQQTPNLEEQLRRMILGNVNMQTRPGEGVRYHGKVQAPNVRLPLPQQAHQMNQAEFPPLGAVRQSQAPAHANHQTRDLVPEHQRESRLYQGIVPLEPRGDYASTQRYHGPDYPLQFGAHASGQAAQGSGYQERSNQMDPNAYQRLLANNKPPGSGMQKNKAPHPQRQLYSPNPMREPMPYRSHGPQGNFAGLFLSQAQFLDQLAATEVGKVGMDALEMNQKEDFRVALQALCDEIHLADPERIPKVTLQCFGSIKSGFATKGSDMDLVIAVEGQEASNAKFSLMEFDLPRALEKKLLVKGFGARLLTKARVPIIKVCENPDVALLDRLREEREKWDFKDNDFKYPHMNKDDENDFETEGEIAQAAVSVETASAAASSSLRQSRDLTTATSESTRDSTTIKRTFVGNLPFQASKEEWEKFLGGHLYNMTSVDLPADKQNGRPTGFAFVEFDTQMHAMNAIRELDGQRFLGRKLKVNFAYPPGITVAERDLLANELASAMVESVEETGSRNECQSYNRTDEKDDFTKAKDAREILDMLTTPVKPPNFTRERKHGPLDFPKDGVGIQCDVNFFNPLGLHNTELLRLYALCDPRVKPIVLFVKTWAKRRGINSSYSGTLSSYGYVLMMLHYLINIASPPVLPNLQGPWRPGLGYSYPGSQAVELDGWVVDFWRTEAEIVYAVQHGQLTQNADSVGSLLRGFIEYYARPRSSDNLRRGFGWTQDVLSLRTPGGLLSKQDKGWTGARTEAAEGKEVRHRYLLALEDPFELSHNVGRTVTHDGIVAIRDEFRRADRIVMAASYGQPFDNGEGDLLAALADGAA